MHTAANDLQGNDEVTEIFGAKNKPCVLFPNLCGCFTYLALVTQDGGFCFNLIVRW